MPAFSGKFQYLDAAGAALQQGACELSFDTETGVVTRAGGVPLAFDLGDVDVYSPAEWELTLGLFTGKRFVLRQFGAAFGRVSEELLKAWRNRTVRCLLLEDLEEVAHFSGTANGAASEIRIYGSNLAVLPLGRTAMQWRLAEVDSVAFDDASYTFTLQSGGDQLRIAKLGQKTEEFGEKLRATLGKLRQREAEVLHLLFPFLDPDQLQQLVMLAPEGRSVKLTALAGIHRDLPEALIARAVDEPLRPYFQSLRKRTAPGGLMTGFKFVRKDEVGAGPGEEAAGEETSGSEASGVANDTGQPLFFWFFFPMAGRNVAAWEATSGSGRATYFFRTGTAVEESIGRLTRGLALVNFRREPVYLSDTVLEQKAEFHRYAIGRRKLPELAELRAAFLGRAIHSSVEAWEKQVAEAGG